MNAKWRRYSDEELEFLREGYKRMNMTDLVAAFNKQFKRSRTAQQIKSTLANYGYKSGRGRNHVPYTEEQIAFLKQEYPNMTAKKLAILFNAKFSPKRSLSSIRHILLRFGPRKNSQRKGARSSYTEEQIAFLRENYKTMTAPELQAAFNSEFKTDKQYWAIVNILKTYGIRRYKRRALEVGDETFCRATGYITVKTNSPSHNMKTKRNYRYKHIVVWENTYGPVPDGKYVRFLDGDKTNCALDNLVLVTCAEHALLNQMDLTNLHPDLRPTAICTAQLQAKCLLLEKENR